MTLTREDLESISILLNPVTLEIGDVKQDIKDMKQDIKDINVSLDSMKQEIRDMKQEIKDINGSLDSMQKHLSDIKLTLENETNRNIKIIAEGHLDLNHKLSESLKISNEKETLLIRVTILENELRQIKEQLKQMEKTA